MTVRDLARMVVDTAERSVGGWGIEYLGPDGTRLWFGVHRRGLGRQRDTVMRFLVIVDTSFDDVRARSQIEQFVRNPASGTVGPIGPRQLRGYPAYLAYLRTLRTAVLAADPGARVVMTPE
ncbi:hypothetical protein CH254_22805 [Rhodococcus sp. 06-412-2C]|nr:hypothetical protein CH254_22805 [Rhodococcus sp. 06-412-2C]OZC93938.1 hypothetical protein CH279_20885 [Rhodococcus sp. 06-412-2B]